MSEKAERRKARNSLRKEKAQRDLLIRELLAREDGRKFIWWLLQVGKFGVQPFAQDPHLTAFSCGELNVGQQVFAAIVEADPAGFLRMQQEINDARTAADANAGANTDSDSRANSDTYPDADSGASGSDSD